MSSPHEIERYITRYTKAAPNILDVSTGLGKNGYLIRIFSKPFYLVGVDIFRPYLELVKHHRIYDDVVLCDVSKLPFIENSFEVTVVSEVIEHLEKENGLLLLTEADRISKHRIIVATPNKPPARGGIETDEGYNQYEAHRSSWRVSDFKTRGFQVFGMGFYFSRFFGRYEQYIDLLFSYSTMKLPNLAAELVAVKEKPKSKHKEKI